MLDEMMQVTASVILHSVFSTDSGETLLRIKNSIESMISHISRMQMSPVQVPHWVPTPGNLRFRQAKKLVTTYIHELITRRRAIPTEQWPDDLLTKLMTIRDEETGTLMAEQLLVDNGLTMFAAGHETTARTLSFLWYALSQNPEVERQLHAELDSVLGDAPPTINDLKKLPYTLRVVKEVLRLYPAAPMYARDAVADDALDGVRIPAGTRTVVFAYATHRHPAFWDEPERFDPDRWLPEREAARHDYAYHPFAIGPRICLGNNFSLLETHVMAAMLARRFKLRLKPGHVPRFELFGTLGFSNGLPMLIEAR
jgi:cytochrome P450